MVKDSAQQLSTMKSLLLLEGNDVLKWQVFEDGDRPFNFTPTKGNIVILRRKNDYHLSSSAISLLDLNVSLVFIFSSCLCIKRSAIITAAFIPGFF